MIFVSLFMIAIAIIYPLVNYKDRFSYTLSIHLIVMSILMILSVLYFSKVATYQIFFDIDYKLYLWLLQIRLPLNTRHYISAGPGIYSRASGLLRTNLKQHGFRG